MPENPKDVLRRLHGQTAAKQAAQAKERQRQERRRRQPADGEPESEAAQWVRDNLTWDEHLELWIPPNCSYSDYSGSFLDKANIQALVRDYPAIFQESGGGHGWTTCGMTEDTRLGLTPEEFESVKDVIEGLEDYPVIDEDLFSQLEYEGKEEFWNEYGRDAIREALVDKFADDVNAQIAVASRSNLFWDEMYNEKEWDQNIEEETGCNFYLRGESAVEDVEREEVVDDDLVLKTKRHIFEKEGVEPLLAALERLGVDTQGFTEEQLWGMVTYAEGKANPEDFWSVDKRFHVEEGECNPIDYVTFDGKELAKFMAQEGVLQDFLRREWYQDPRQLRFRFEAGRQAQCLVHVLLDAEDPKQVFRAAVLPRLLDGKQRGVRTKAESPQSILVQLPRFTFRATAHLGDQVFVQSELDSAWPLPIGCVTRDPDGGYRIVTGAPTRLGWKWWEQVQPEVFALRFSSRDSAAKEIWHLWKQSGAVREAEDPKSVLRRAKDPLARAKLWVGGMPKEIEVWGKRWFNRTYGNTYFSARIYVDGQLVHTLPMEYGYGDQYLRRAFDWLEREGFVPPSASPHEPPSLRCRDNGIRLNYHAEDVRRRRDLFQ